MDDPDVREIVRLANLEIRSLAASDVDRLFPIDDRHGPREATLEQHTHHRTGSAGSQCIACHMPKIESEGVPGSFVRSHTFQFISPAMTSKYKMPNPCTSCHADKTIAWATAQMENWSNVSPWRVGN